MEDTNTKKATTVGAYAEDVEFVNSIKGDGRKQADALAEIVADYRRHRSQTAGQGAADERDRLQSRLDEAESDVRKAASASEAARAGESAAKAKAAELQERLTAAVEARAAAEKEASGLRARLADAENSAKIAEVEFAARTENLATQLEAARADAEHGRGNVAFLSSQADDLRRQLDEARRENDRLRAQLDAREGGGR